MMASIVAIEGPIIPAPFANAATDQEFSPEPKLRMAVFREWSVVMMADAAEEAGLDIYEPCRRLVMNWDELRDLSNEPLVTIGAHTTHHYALAKLSAARARNEIFESVKRIEDELGRPCRHFSYPYGSECSAGRREFAMAERFGLSTAVTTRKGLIGAGGDAQATALPRLSLNGDFQRERYIKALLSGVPFALRNAVKARLPAKDASYGIGPLKVGPGVASILR